MFVSPLYVKTPFWPYIKYTFCKRYVMSHICPFRCKQYIDGIYFDVHWNIFFTEAILMVHRLNIKKYCPIHSLHLWKYKDTAEWVRTLWWMSRSHMVHSKGIYLSKEKEINQCQYLVRLKACSSAMVSAVLWRIARPVL